AKTCDDRKPAVPASARLTPASANTLNLSRLTDLVPQLQPLQEGLEAPIAVLVAALLLVVDRTERGQQAARPRQEDPDRAEQVAADGDLEHVTAPTPSRTRCPGRRASACAA